ncbi:MAG: DUF2314 domain-containing protein [Verrucomicrobiota bacterium]
MKTTQTIAFCAAIGLLSSGGFTETKAQTEDSNYILVDEDSLVDLGVAEAKETIADFDHAFKNRDDSMTEFAVKKPFPYGDGSHEHMWVAVTEVTPEGYQGYLNNTPYDATYVEIGQEMFVKRDEISDWMYNKDDKLIGGYTIAAIVFESPPEQRAAYSKQMGIDWKRYKFLSKPIKEEMEARKKK